MSEFKDFVLSNNRINKGAKIKFLVVKKKKNKRIPFSLKTPSVATLKEDLVINNSYKENFDSYLIDKNGEKTLLGTVKNPFIDFIFEINFLTITDNKIKYVKKLKMRSN